MMAKMRPTIPTVLPGSAAGCGVAWYSAMVSPHRTGASEVGRIATVKWLTHI
jgi:hypothetical protein